MIIFCPETVKLQTTRYLKYLSDCWMVRGELNNKYGTCYITCKMWLKGSADHLQISESKH